MAAAKKLSPPRHLVEAARDAGLLPPVKEPIMIYGNMLTDNQIIESELKTLLFAGHDYGSKLRVIRGAAKRIQDAIESLTPNA